ncbi:glycerol-3-phosphate dehydrogenase [Undibacter mobilis]|uniref:Glycerol-3-phosphate dehydrogenase n=1 Tax=Undibacter mobilis TaxID=2292256 RepID=A0A371BAP5_9BRAD|nr:glycerol-3-phosphate dehydrogenase [Undibacter mobilis]RDV04612.1 glycerol-3-phosphate dehydrogenase [Undibacter mobilis]
MAKTSQAGPETADFDLAIIGGGINGAGLARDAAGRGLKVLLVEMNDLAAGTSSASSKLIHGGLRYLEHRAFRLVREALSEREVLLGIAPHVVRPMRFVLPPALGQRSPLLLRFGLWLYDVLGARKLLPPSRTIDLTHNVVGQPLKRAFRYAFEYSDCWVDDSRLVVLNALDAAARGATIRTRTRCVRADRRGGLWELVLHDHGRRDTATAKVLVNAAGPWIGEVAENVLRKKLTARLRLIKGSHIVVRKLFDHDSGYIFQAPDKRVVFALPFAGEFTLIGTTDENFVGDLNSPAPSADEILYLCDVVNRYFRHPVTPDELAWSFSGVRALYDDGKGRPEDVTRDYHLELEAPRNEAPLLTIYGGKITTYRRLAEAAMVKLGRIFPGHAPWTARAKLPGGEFEQANWKEVLAEMQTRWPFLPEAMARRILRAYGLRAERFLGDAESLEALGPILTGDLTAAEIRYLVENEWAESAEDILWRRGKLGLTATADEREAIDRLIGVLRQAADQG